MTSTAGGSNNNVPPSASSTAVNDGMIEDGPSTTSLQLPTVTVVTRQRKEELLVQARAGRRNWISRVPLPYSPQVRARAKGNGNAGDDHDGGLSSRWWSMNDTLYKVQSAPVCQKYLRSATSTLSELYGLNEGDSSAPSSMTVQQVAERVGKLIEPYELKQESSSVTSSHVTDDSVRALDETTNGGTIRNEGRGDTDVMSDDVATAYHDFWMALLLPESALLVQAMRNFCLNWTTHVLPSSSLSTSASALNAYIKATYESLPSSHVAWKDRSHVDSGLPLRRSLESFLYGHLQSNIADRMDPTKHKWKDGKDDAGRDESLFIMTQDEFDMRLDELQFVQPSHLEIACLQDDGSDDSVVGNLETLLQEPINALLSMDAYYSPYEKLQRILLTYQGVNASLSAALNNTSSSSSSSSGRVATKLPSADDVLPTIILICIRARPKNLLRDLQFIEAFALQEYLRGEAGYAYTNLYGAVQFLQDLDLVNLASGGGGGENNSSNSLSITPQELKVGLEKSRATAKHRQQGIGQAGPGLGASIRKGPAGEDDIALASTVPPPQLSVVDVRTARMRGENVDLEWATKLQESKLGELSSQPQEAPMLDAPTAVVPLPEGFARSYTFLGARPEDIRVSDLPNLLEEYRMLVQVTEDLLAERSARITAEKKRHANERQRALGEQLLLATAAEMGQEEKPN